MGGCLSLDAVDESSSCAFVVSIKGEMMSYPTPIFVSEVVDQSSGCFVCNSDSLYYDQPIPAMDSDQQLEIGQIYFILHKTLLHRRLSASQMAALALKATLALHHSTSTTAARISPFIHHHDNHDHDDDDENNYLSHKKQKQIINIGGSRSCRKKAAARLAVRSFSMRLSTIYENDDHDLLAN